MERAIYLKKYANNITQYFWVVFKAWFFNGIYLNKSCKIS